jgi:nicotinate-nucleotide adenylyltransferase
MRIGIYSGSFDPVHSGHIGFALKAVKAAGLDKVVFLPERKPRGKVGVTHYAHRVAMLRAALAAHPRLDVLELPDQQFFPRTVSRLNKLYPEDQLLLLLGSDIVYGLSKWPNIETLLRRCGIIIGMRSADPQTTIDEKLKALPMPPAETHIMPSPAADISSRDIREALKQNTNAPGLLASVKRYSTGHWLYKRIPE